VRKPNRPTQPQNQTRPEAEEEEEEEEEGEQIKIILMIRKSKNPEILPQNCKKKHTHTNVAQNSAHQQLLTLLMISEPPSAIPRLRSLSLSLSLLSLLSHSSRAAPPQGRLFLACGIRQ
jgi:hypothetical protein